jgi:DNA-binding GntR family transcriptional regulator
MRLISRDNTADTASLAQTLPEKIAQALADRIIAGEYQPGERLIEGTLAKALNVSHGPIRDALRLLQNSGLVTIAPYRGACVTELSEREIREIYQVRAALVGLRARWFAEDPQRDALVAKIEGPIAALATLAGAPDRQEDYIATALRISSILTEGLTNRWLGSTLQALALQTRRYTRLALASPERRRESARLWGQLLKAIKAGDGDRAESVASTLSLSTRDAAAKTLRLLQSGSPPGKAKRQA